AYLSPPAVPRRGPARPRHAVALGSTIKNTNLPPARRDRGGRARCAVHGGRRRRRPEWLVAPADDRAGAGLDRAAVLVARRDRRGRAGGAVDGGRHCRLPRGVLGGNPPDPRAGPR